MVEDRVSVSCAGLNPIRPKLKYTPKVQELQVSHRRKALRDPNRPDIGTSRQAMDDAIGRESGSVARIPLWGSIGR